MNLEKKDNKLYYVNNKNEYILLSEDETSKPVVSPNKKKIAFISPYEWESVSKLLLYDIDKQLTEIVINPDNYYKVPKNVIWVNDDKLAVIIGFGMGTVSIGGNIYIYDLNSKSTKAISEYPDRIQITDLKINNDELLLKGIEYSDDQFTNFKEFTDTLKV